jgi:hypothetical protein
VFSSALNSATTNAVPLTFSIVATSASEMSDVIAPSTGLPSEFSRLAE